MPKGQARATARKNGVTSVGSSTAVAHVLPEKGEKMVDWIVPGRSSATRVPTEEISQDDRTASREWVFFLVVALNVGWVALALPYLMVSSLKGTASGGVTIAHK